MAAALVVLSNLAVTWSWLHRSAPDILAARLPGVFVIVVSTAVVRLGPGAYSIDTRLFGRRESIGSTLIRSAVNTDAASSDCRTTLDALS
jgi:hypothetical protein